MYNYITHINYMWISNNYKIRLNIYSFQILIRAHIILGFMNNSVFPVASKPSEDPLNDYCD